MQKALKSFHETYDDDKNIFTENAGDIEIKTRRRAY